ncbi:rhomboid protein 1, mitochondrial [Cladorrhinum samala]|uniref:Rhomboid protein 1, mitochondrial n=1 Tax=Cladorrhinum samala TaxID=585594 RepID=A0AAV9H9Z6_9PEZI|nr:rhomboid protein 1, mitochondrial [Cladorrhinum samala]
MSCCTLGVNAFRSSAQIAAKHLSNKSTSAVRFLPSLSRRFFSSGLFCSATQQARAVLPTPHGLLIRSASWSSPTQRLTVRTIFTGDPVFVHYTELPPNYADETGLAFRRHDLKAAEVLALFGPGMSTAEANKLLRILHGRRVAGTLEDPSLAFNLLAYNKKQQAIALDYLRKHVPVDEVTNAGLRAEDELRALEGKAVENEEEGDNEGKEQGVGDYASQLLYKDPAGSSTSVYGNNSAFDAIRAKNKAKWEAELKRREEAAKKKQEEDEALGKSTARQVVPLTEEERRELMSPRMKEWRRRATSDIKEPPPLTAWERLGPTAIFVLLIVGTAGSVAVYYHPPKRSERLFPDIPPAAATVGAIILANMLVAAAWKTPAMYRVLNKYFLLCPGIPVVPSILGAMFSHQALFGHFLPNMVVLWFIGTRLHDDVGRANFLTIYFASGLFGFLATMVESVILRNLAITTMGASGAIYGLMGAYFWLHRLEGFKILNLPPPPSEGIHGIVFLSIAVGLNIAGLFGKKRFVFDIISHLAGAAVGVAAGHILERRSAMARRRIQGGKAGGGEAASAATAPLPTKA